MVRIRNALGQFEGWATASIDGKKLCPHCEETKPIAEFTLRRHKEEKLHSWCKVCTTAAVKRWARTPKGKESNRRRMKARTRRYKQEVFKAYGAFCACCGETQFEFLCLDHIDGGGRKHRRAIGAKGSGAAFYRWVQKNGYPKMLQVLCHNCNMAKGFFGQCPHSS